MCTSSEFIKLDWGYNPAVRSPSICEVLGPVPSPAKTNRAKSRGPGPERLQQEGCWDYGDHQELEASLGYIVSPRLV